MRFLLERLKLFWLDITTHLSIGIYNYVSATADIVRGKLLQSSIQVQLQLCWTLAEG